MSTNYYLLEKLAEAHRQELLRQAEQQRLLAQLPQPDRKVLLPSLARLKLSLRALRTRVRKGLQRRIA
jgi:hypothetical protein